MVGWVGGQMEGMMEGRKEGREGGRKGGKKMDGWFLRKRWEEPRYPQIMFNPGAYHTFWKCFAFLPCSPPTYILHPSLKKFLWCSKENSLTPPFPGITEHQASILQRTLFWYSKHKENHEAKLGWMLWNFSLDLSLRKG